MREVQVKASNLQKFFLPLILIFIIADVVSDNYIFGSFNSETPILEFSLFTGLLILQMIASPIQAGLSDFYGRKKALVISLGATLLTLVVVLFHGKSILLYVPILFLKGVLGNTIPIAWAAIGDTIGDANGRNFRFSFALSECSYAVGYLLLIFINKSFSVNNSIIVLILFMVVVVFLCLKLFCDVKDGECKDINKPKMSLVRFAFNEFSLVIHDLKIKKLRLILWAFCLWEISIYCILVYFADFLTSQASITEILMMSGYLIGSFMMKFFWRIDDNLMIKYGYKISLFSLLPYLILLPFLNNMNYILSVCYFFHSIGNAILSPTLLSLVSKEKEPHERGKIYGLVESVDTLAFFIASIAIIFCKKFQLDLFYLVFLSFITMAVSWWPYVKYARIKRNEV